MGRFNYAITPEPYAQPSRLVEYSITSGSAKKVFDAKANVATTISSFVSSTKIGDSLMYSAAAALQRQSNMTETPEEWAERLSNDFFSDL